MIEDKSVAVVIPCFGVEKQIGPLLARVPAYVDRIFVVDDGSPDGTAAAVSAVDDPRITLLRHSHNQGVGAAMATGYRAALDEGADLIVKCDGDGQMDPSDIQFLVRPLVEGGAEYAKGCRFHHVGELDSMPRVRFAGNIALTFLTKLASGYWHVLDPQNGFVAVGGGTLRRIRIDRLAKGYFFENDMLIRLNAIEARVADVPLPSRYAGEPSSLKPGRIALQFPEKLLAGFFRRVFWRYVFYDVSPVALFLLFGFLLFAFGAIFGAYHWIWGMVHNRPTQTGTVIVAAVPFILGFQLLLQAFVLDIQNTPRPESRRRPESARPGS
ncbi:MAG TPA: glycosyltransferase family 2 protein [Thermoanaerobaculia bacterium]|nr:glycosyltransferase family 2 protein [Thermoanaerobaculia bacterium]